MGEGKFSLLILMLFLCLTISVNAQVKGAKNKPRTIKKSVICKSDRVSFPCPKEYKIVLNGDNPNQIFLAQNLEFGYSVFVVAPKGNFDKQNLEIETKKIILKTLYPKESQNYIWKDVGFPNNKASSKFEVSKKLSLGFNGNQIVSIDYRHISADNKDVIVGTIVDGFETGEEAKNDFNSGVPLTSGGCFDAVKLTRSITGEKESEKLDPCSLTIGPAI